LLQRGAAAEDLARVTCPIGAALSGKEPGVIAVGVAAELLRLRERAQRASQPATLAASTAIGARMRALRSRPDPEQAQ
jgi:xanthine/CO dehydrogenase XdhC/CoxF family maturation factor